ncbi:hypothetical protein STBA_29300 [Streptomyces sp. MP131-18]|nr:hypothetical protein STBA_29300 [Streptomyces sp. MP131-18]
MPRISQAPAISSSRPITTAMVTSNGPSQIQPPPSPSVLMPTPGSSVYAGMVQNHSGNVSNAQPPDQQTATTVNEKIAHGRCSSA